MISLLTVMVAMLIAAPFSLHAWRKGRKDKALFYLFLAAAVGYIVGSNLFMEISPGTIKIVGAR